jgi:putative pyruvate formate lyase activating enzyme
MRVLSTNKPDAYSPRYLKAYRDGILESNIIKGEALLKKCRLCPRNCEVNRYIEKGKVCAIGKSALVSNNFPHFGEESCLVGSHGSGTIFFTSCNLRCAFCQNWDISHFKNGREVSSLELAKIMVDLQDRECHNINFVTPSHVVVPILKAVKLAVEMGLTIPLVYNTSAYDSVESLKLLDGIIDIYMPDFKFWYRKSANRFMKAPDYPKVVRRNIRIMHKQVGDLHVNNHGIAMKGLLVRHLVLPDHLKDTYQIIQFLANQISLETALNIMFQYHPEYNVNRNHYPELNRSLSLEERECAKRFKKKFNLLDYPWL